VSGYIYEEIVKNKEDVIRKETDEELEKRLKDELKIWILICDNKLNNRMSEDPNEKWKKILLNPYGKTKDDV